MKKTKKITVSAAMCALGAVILYIGSLTGIMDISAVVIASLAVMFVDFEIKMPYSIAVYVITSIISMLILPNKETALMYLLFGGIYPIIKRFLMKITPKALSYAARIAVFAAALSALLWITKKFFMVPDYQLMYDYIWLVYIIAVAVFILYDYVLEKLTAFYFFRLRPRIERLLK